MTAARRARQDWQKQERRQALLHAAEGLFLEGEGALPSVAAVAAAAGLAKGTVYLYFRSKEEIFLGLLEWRLGGWIEALRESLASADGFDPQCMVDATCNYLEREPSTLMLASYGHSVLERNIDQDRLVEFKRGMNEAMALLGEAIHAHRPDISVAHASRLVLQKYAFVVGLYQMTSSPDHVRAALDKAGAELLRMDFATELRAGLLAFWRGSLP